MEKKVKGIGLIIVFIGLLILLIYSYFNKGIVYFLMNGDIQLILNYLQNFRQLAIILFVLLIILEVVFAPIPPFILYVAGGLFFGSFYGGTLSLIGNLIGAGFAFEIANYWGRDFIGKKIPSPLWSKFDNFFYKYGALSIFILRINPFTSTDFFSYIAGLTKMKFWRFILATTFGLAPSIYLQSYLGQTIASNPLWFKLFILFGFIYVAIFVTIFVYFKTKKKKD